MPSLATEISEIVTGLGTLGLASVEAAVTARPPELIDVEAATWARLGDAIACGDGRDLFDLAFDNGLAFLAATDALAGRRPRRIEWRGPQRVPGYDFLPADVRVDHVYLISCKYRSSQVLANVSPAHLFVNLMYGRAPRAGDWYEDVAPAEYDEFYAAVRRELAGEVALPDDRRALDPGARRAIAKHLPKALPSSVRAYSDAWAVAVAKASAGRWSDAMPDLATRELMLWRLLRLHSVPYFVLGADDSGPFRLRVTTPADWRREFALIDLSVHAQPGRQPRVAWTATVKRLEGGDELVVFGHVQVRWSHGRFAGAPEAKVYLDTDHRRIPGYFPLV